MRVHIAYILFLSAIVLSTYNEHVRAEKLYVHTMQKMTNQYIKAVEQPNIDLMICKSALDFVFSDDNGAE